MQKSGTLIVLISLDGYIIESYGCSINPDEDMGDIRKAIKAWHAYAASSTNDMTSKGSEATQAALDAVQTCRG